MHRQLRVGPMLLYSVISATALPSASAQSPHQLAGCEYQWRPVTIKSADRNTLVDYPQITSWRGKLLAVGDPALSWSDTRSERPTLIGGVSWTANGTQALLPAIGTRVVMYPRPAATSDGLLHVVYGTRVDLTNRKWTTLPDTLWHSAYDGRKWSVPELMPSSSSGLYFWENISPSSLIASGRLLDIAIPLRSRDSTVIALLHRDPRLRWTLHPVVTGSGLALYVRLARIGSALILSWAAPDPKIVSGDRASVFAMRSQDNGSSWSSPQRIHLAGHGTTYDHVLLVDSTSRVAFLLWRQHSGDPQRASDTIGVATSTDSGRVWRVLPPLAIARGFTSLQGALSKWGPVVLFDELGSEGIQVALFSKGRWVRAQRNSSEPLPNGAAVSSWSSSSLIVLSTKSAPARLPDTPSVRTLPAMLIIRLTLSNCEHTGNFGG